MMKTIPASCLNRFKQDHYKKLKKVVEDAKNSEKNEADTVRIISDIFSKLLGFDEYNEITREHQIRGTYCDLAVEIDKKVEILIEVKAAYIPLKESHMRQARDYGVNKGVEWVVLTNGVEWQVYKIIFKQPVDSALIIQFNFLEINLKKNEDQRKLFLLSKEGMVKDSLKTFSDHLQIVNEFSISAIISGTSVKSLICKELKKMGAISKVEDSEVDDFLERYVIKKVILEDDKFKEASKHYNKVLNKKK